MPDGAQSFALLNAEDQSQGQNLSTPSDGSPHLTLLVDAADESNSGRWVDGKLQGRASMLFTNGDRYDGPFRDGQREGLGVYSWKDGSRYEGEFIANKICGLGGRWEEGRLVHCGRWRKNRLEMSCPVPVRCIPENEGKLLSDAGLWQLYASGGLRSSHLLPVRSGALTSFSL